MFVWRAGIADERSEDYVLTARAKAVPEHVIRDRHVARNVALPVLARSFVRPAFLVDRPDHHRVSGPARFVRAGQ